MSSILRDFLAIDREQELLQSFIRLEVPASEEAKKHDNNATKRKVTSFHLPKRATDNRIRKSVRFYDEVNITAEKSSGQRTNRIEAELKAVRKKTEDLMAKKKKPKENFVDFYTDKDRAAAVSAGTYDIKQSLQIKQKQDRNESLLIPDEADISSIIALGLKEIKNANPKNALQFFSKALELNNTDINALVSRSKCYLMLGEPRNALADAETALAEDRNNIRAIYQKAESLYFLGRFEESLMYFHRGLRARPELQSFRLGVQKTKEAIENTLGSHNVKPTTASKIKSKRSGIIAPKSQSTIYRPLRIKPSKLELERRNSRKLLGKLCVDKEYLETLLKHPDLVRADTRTEHISTYVKDAVEFLNKRQEFWHQQRPCTALPKIKKLNADTMPGWF